MPLMIRFLFLLFAIVQVNQILAGNEQTSSKKNGARQAKFLSLFNIIQFRQDQCVTASDTTMRGTCMTRDECSSASGSADGNCAAGFGVCCMFTAVCGTNTAVNRNCTYLQNMGFPSSATASTTCTFNFNRISDNLCQIRLDFDNFVSNNPAAIGANTGSCATTTDFLTVTSNGGTDPPVVCGTLTGQHMYLETGTTGTAGQAVVTFGAATATTRTFKIKVTYLTCDNTAKAPSGCVQYFTGTSGTIMSYNHQGGTHLSGQNYLTCIRQELGFCDIDYAETANTTPDAFNLFGSIAIEVPPESETVTCPSTFLQIPNSDITSNSDRICGGAFNTIDNVVTPGTIRGQMAPFTVLTFSITNLGTGAINPLTGYSLDYRQVPCM